VRSWCGAGQRKRVSMAAPKQTARRRATPILTCSRRSPPARAAAFRAAGNTPRWSAWLSCPASFATCNSKSSAPDAQGRGSSRSAATEHEVKIAAPRAVERAPSCACFVARTPRKPFRRRAEPVTIVVDQRNARSPAGPRSCRIRSCGAPRSGTIPAVTLPVLVEVAGGSIIASAKNFPNRE